MESINILLVDDEPKNLDALEAILDDQGYNLLRAEDAERALRLLLEHAEVAAIILDIHMPHMSGIELAKTIKSTKRFREIPILFLTAYMVGEDDVLTGYGAGAVDYLTKPFDPEILRHKIAVFAELFRKTRALAELNDQLEQRVKERTAELERSEAALRDAARQKDDFLATLAHELRNPLAPLRTGLDLLLRVLPSGSLAPAVPRTLAAMDRQLSHIVRLIDDLLDVSRISRGLLQLRREPCDLSAIVKSAVEAAQPVFQRRGQLVSVTVPDSLEAFVDETRVTQIVANLLSNAAKFTPERGTIEVELVRDGDAGVLRVVDSGSGIPADQLERVFEMFARMERPGAGGDGLGVGLALARRLAELHGGRLDAESAGDGKGTTFRLRLPVQSPRDAPAERASAAGANQHSEAVLDIVVIEDNEDVAQSLLDFLEALGHHVSVARSGMLGIEMVERVQPDVVLCDLGLPDLDGLDVCRQVRARPLAAQPVMVALTGWGREDDRRRTKEAGFDRHLVKPVGASKLEAVLAGIDAGRGQQS